MNTPNSALRAARLGLRMSQDDFARAIQAAGRRVGQPNDASKRLVQRWESGTTAAPRPVYARALEAVTGQPVETLGFVPAALAQVSSDGHGGHDTTSPTAELPVAVRPSSPQATVHGHYSGVWLSRYEFFSSGRDNTYVGQHYVVVTQYADRLSVRSIEGSAASILTIDMTVDGSVVTGTWVEQTDPNGYYRGARYHGAIQMLAEPTGRRLAGKWVGFGKDLTINSGPWELVFQDAGTDKATLDRYNREPESPTDSRD